MQCCTGKHKCLTALGELTGSGHDSPRKKRTLLSVHLNSFWMIYKVNCNRLSACLSHTRCLLSLALSAPKIVSRKSCNLVGNQILISKQVWRANRYGIHCPLLMVTWVQILNSISAGVVWCSWNTGLMLYISGKWTKLLIRQISCFTRLI